VNEKRSTSLWVLVLQLLNLPPEERVKEKNLIPVAVISGPVNEDDIFEKCMEIVVHKLKVAEAYLNMVTFSGTQTLDLTFTYRMMILYIVKDM
jgi:hypothetical protein